MRVKMKRRKIIPGNGTYLHGSWRSARQGEKALFVAVAVRGEAADMRRRVR
jgi:hypothetical protein